MMLKKIYKIRSGTLFSVTSKPSGLRIFCDVSQIRQYCSISSIFLLLVRTIWAKSHSVIAATNLAIMRGGGTMALYPALGLSNPTGIKIYEELRWNAGFVDRGSVLGISGFVVEDEESD